MEPKSARFVDLLYEELFAEEPHLRILFEGPMDEQHRKLASLIGFAVRQLEDPAPLLAALRDLGARHVRFGVKPHHFDVLGRAWSAALERMNGLPDTAEHRAAWSAFYTFLVEGMREGAAVTA